jgi:hypothetical protein
MFESRTEPGSVRTVTNMGSVRVGADDWVGDSVGEVVGKEVGEGVEGEVGEGVEGS